MSFYTDSIYDSLTSYLFNETENRDLCDESWSKYV